MPVAKHGVGGKLLMRRHGGRSITTEPPVDGHRPLDRATDFVRAI